MRSDRLMFRASAVHARRLDEHDDDDDVATKTPGSRPTARRGTGSSSVSVWIVKTPTTVPAIVNLPPMSEVPPSTTARIAYSSM